MGTYINLSILPTNISSSEWELIYDESLELLKAYPFADIEEREFFGYKVQTYVKAAENLNPVNIITRLHHSNHLLHHPIS